MRINLKTKKTNIKGLVNRAWNRCAKACEWINSFLGAGVIHQIHRFGPTYMENIFEHYELKEDEREEFLKKFDMFVDDPIYEAGAYSFLGPLDYDKEHVDTFLGYCDTIPQFMMMGSLQMCEDHGDHFRHIFMTIYVSNEFPNAQATVRKLRLADLGVKVR